ncbi:MAG: serine protease [Desulfobulbia bacterium]
MVSTPSKIKFVTLLACFAWGLPVYVQSADKGSIPYLKTIESQRTGLDRNRRIDKIVDGKPAEPGQFPWQVALLTSAIKDNERALLCGGTLITPRWIVTAAHCVDSRKTPDQLQVLIGETSLRKSTAKRTDIKKIVVHPNWDSSTRDNDIALLLLQSPVNGTEIRPIPIISPNEERTFSPETKFIVSGWGATSESGPISFDLLWAEVGFIATSICNETTAYNGKLTDNMLCAGAMKGERDSCLYDSGGPLVLQSTPDKLVGIVIGGDGCARPNKPGIYTRVAKFATWIADETK